MSAHALSVNLAKVIIYFIIKDPTRHFIITKPK